MVKTTILEDDTVAKRANKLCAKEKEGKSGSGTWTWWEDGLRTDDERVGCRAISPIGDGWTVFRCSVGTVRMEIFDTDLCAIGAALRKSVA